jgi:7-carboxy-7-deazaguanine synthase
MVKQLNFDLSPIAPKISQHFTSLEGEGDAVGTPSIYIRVAGCYSAACAFCDTKFSWGTAKTFKSIGDPDISRAIKKDLSASHANRCTITGGEPLHFTEWFPDIYMWVDSLTEDGLNFMGIESNGNLLHKTENCFALIKSFNKINREHGILPTLTVSPKLDAETCYDKQMTQKDVDEMYYQAFDNISDYLHSFNVFYKFIHDYTGKFVDFDHQLEFINYLINDLNVSRNNILLMPFTPEDPLGKDKEFWEESKDATSRKALQLGLRYSPRIHIDRKLD